MEQTSGVLIRPFRCEELNNGLLNRRLRSDLLCDSFLSAETKHNLSKTRKLIQYLFQHLVDVPCLKVFGNHHVAADIGMAGKLFAFWSWANLGPRDLQYSDQQLCRQ